MGSSIIVSQRNNNSETNHPTLHHHHEYTRAHQKQKSNYNSQLHVKHQTPSHTHTHAHKALSTILRRITRIRNDHFTMNKGILGERNLLFCYCIHVGCFEHAQLHVQYRPIVITILPLYRTYDIKPCSAAPNAHDTSCPPIFLTMCTVEVLGRP